LAGVQAADADKSVRVMGYESSLCFSFMSCVSPYSVRTLVRPFDLHEILVHAVDVSPILLVLIAKFRQVRPHWEPEISEKSKTVL